MDILLKPDEWGELDYQLAQKILNDRGRPVGPELLAEFKKKRLEQLKKPEKTEYSSIVLGYVFTILFSPAAIFLGHMLAYSKKQLPDGQSIYAYSSTQRFHGRIILFTSIGLTIFYTAAVISRSLFLSYD